MVRLEVVASIANHRCLSCSLASPTPLFDVSSDCVSRLMVPLCGVFRCKSDIFVAEVLPGTGFSRGSVERVMFPEHLFSPPAGCFGRRKWCRRWCSMAELSRRVMCDVAGAPCYDLFVFVWMNTKRMVSTGCRSK